MEKLPVTWKIYFVKISVPLISNSSDSKFGIRRLFRTVGVLTGPNTNVILKSVRGGFGRIGGASRVYAFEFCFTIP